MAFIEDIYVLVTDEEVSDDLELSTHPVEQGMDITDTVRRKAMSISISGKIVDYASYEWGVMAPTQDASFQVKAATALSRLKNYAQNGTLVTYLGRNYARNMQIKSFTTSHPNTNAGGADFEMELCECRLVANSYAPSEDDPYLADGGEQQIEKGDGEAVYYVTKNGDCVWSLVATSDTPYFNLRRDGAENSPQGRCGWVMEHNPQAFSRPGDFRTLQNGASLLMGYQV